MARLFFIGDSITAGSWDECGGWANRLAGQLMARTGTSANKHKGFYCMPCNLGVSGDTAPDIFRRLKSEITARIFSAAENDTIQFVFAVGVNDSVYLLDEQKNAYSDKEFQNDLVEIIKLAKSFTDNISFIGLLPVDEDRVNPTPWAPDRAYMNQNIKHFNGMIEAVCQKQNIPFLSLFEKWLAMTDYKDYLSDGLHPNTKGHELMAKEIGEFLFTEKFTDFHTKS